MSPKARFAVIQQRENRSEPLQGGNGVGHQPELDMRETLCFILSLKLSLFLPGKAPVASVY